VNDLDAFGAFDYNWAGGKYALGIPTWFGSNNINAEDEEIWDQSLMPDFILPAGSDAIDSGINVSNAFTINNRPIGPLPGFDNPIYTADNNPDMGWINLGQNGEDTTPPAAPANVMVE